MSEIISYGRWTQAHHRRVEQTNNDFRHLKLEVENLGDAIGRTNPLYQSLSQSVQGMQNNNQRMEGLDIKRELANLQEANPDLKKGRGEIDQTVGQIMGLLSKNVNEANQMTAIARRKSHEISATGNHRVADIVGRIAAKANMLENGSVEHRKNINSYTTQLQQDFFGPALDKPDVKLDNLENVAPITQVEEASIGDEYTEIQ